MPIFITVTTCWDKNTILKQSQGDNVVEMDSTTTGIVHPDKRNNYIDHFLITNVMIADMILTLWNTTPAGIAIMGYAAHPLQFTFHPVNTYHLMCIKISIDNGINHLTSNVLSQGFNSWRLLSFKNCQCLAHNYIELKRLQRFSNF